MWPHVKQHEARDQDGTSRVQRSSQGRVQPRRLFREFNIFTACIPHQRAAGDLLPTRPWLPKVNLEHGAAHAG